jgi:hypothetical protein
LTDWDLLIKGNYQLTAFISSSASDLNRSDDTARMAVKIDPNVKITTIEMTNSSSCFSKGMVVYPEVEIINTGNMDLFNAPLRVEVLFGANVTYIYYDTLRGVLNPGDTIAHHIFPDFYTVQGDDPYFNLVSFIEFPCGAMPEINSIIIMECIDLRDLSLDSLTNFTKPYDLFGEEITLKASLTNLDYTADFNNVKITALIDNGTTTDTLRGTINTISVGTTNFIHTFTSTYIVPSVPTYKITVFVDNQDRYTNNDTITIYRNAKFAPESPIITTDTLPDGEIGVAYSATLTAIGDTPLTWTIRSGSGNLPDGLNLSAASGEILGIPTAVGTFTFTVEATNDLGVDAKVLSIVIRDVGINDVEKSTSSIHPNPTSGKIYLSKESNVKVYSILGKLLLETFGKEVDLSPYAQGIYFLQVDAVWTKVIKK